MGKRPEDSQMQHPLLIGNAAWDKDYKTEIKKNNSVQEMGRDVCD